MQASGQELEAILKRDGGIPDEALFEKAEAELARVVGLIEGLNTGTADSSSPSSALPADFEQQLEALVGLLEDYDSAAEEKLWDLLDQVKGSSVESDLVTLKGPIGQYDLEAAAEALKPIIEEVRSKAGRDD